MSMIDILNYRIELIGASFVLGILFAYIAWRRQRKKDAAAASGEFRDTILTELNGLYPVPRYLDKEVCDRFSRSIPGIESAAAQYREFIPPERQKAFDTALKEYREHCSRIKWEDCVSYNASRERGNHELEGPKEIFRQHVNALLSFTKKS